MKTVLILKMVVRDKNGNGSGVQKTFKKSQDNCRTKKPTKNSTIEATLPFPMLLLFS